METIRIDDDSRLQNALVQGVAMGIPGLSVAVGNDEGLLWTGTAGYSDLRRRVAVTPCDRFGVGSITKTFVARVILQLAEEGRLDLTCPVTDYLAPDIARDVPNASAATIRQLINHQSGIPTWEFEPNWIRRGRGELITPGKVWGKTETLDYVRGIDQAETFSPGQQYAYSNTNYTLLGLLIEAITGHDVMAEIRRRILQPLGLDNTFLESFEAIPGGYVHHYHYATPHFAEVAGVHRDFPEIRPYLVETTAANLSPEWAAGGMVSTAGDLVHWARALRQGELLGPTMQAEVFTYYPPREPAPDDHHYMQGVYKINNFFDGRAVLGHSGGTLGFTAMMYWLDGSDLTAVLLTNVGGMHSGLKPSPVGLFYRHVLLPAVMDSF